MLPPFPPSPPLGPPFGTNFSLRNAMQPWPPWPTLTVILASSMNIEIQGIEGLRRSPRRLPYGALCERSGGHRPPLQKGERRMRIAQPPISLLYRLDGDETARVTFVGKLNDAGNFGEKRVVFADPDIDSR